MFDQFLKILLIFGSFSAVARGEDEYTSTSTSTISSNYNECYAGDRTCDWKNDPSTNLSFGMYASIDAAKRLHGSYRDESVDYGNPIPASPRGNSSIRAISPIFCRVDNYGCVGIEYKLTARVTGGLVGLRVYQKPVHIALRDLIAFSDEAKEDFILFEVLGDAGPNYLTKEFPLKHFDSNFQIILEGLCDEHPVYIGFQFILKRRTDCTGYTPVTIPNRQTTSTAISTTTTMSTTTTERAMRENGDTITDKVTKSDTRVDSRSASPQSNLWPTTTWPTTKQQTTTQTLQEGNGCDSRNPPIILSLIAPGNSLIDFRVRPPCSASAAIGALTD